MHTIKKRGIAEVVAVALVVTLAVIASVAVSALIYRLANQVSLAPSLSCSHLQSPPAIVIQSACVDTHTNELHIALSRSSDQLITSLEFIEVNSAGTQEWVCADMCGSCVVLKAGTAKPYFLTRTSQESPETLKIVANGCEITTRAIVSC